MTLFAFVHVLMFGRVFFNSFERDICERHKVVCIEESNALKTKPCGTHILVVYHREYCPTLFFNFYLSDKS